MKKQKKCEYCGKLTDNRKFCSHKCSGYGVGHIGGKIGGKAVSFETHSKGGKMSVKIQEKNKTGIYGMTHQQHINAGKKGGRIGGKRSVERKVGWFSKESHKKGQETMKKNKTGIYGLTIEQRQKTNEKIAKINKKNKKSVYDPKVQYMGLLASRILLTTENMKFSSIPEAEIGLCIHYQIEKIKLWKNYQFIIGRKRIDFFILDTFIEVHPNKEGYYEKRRKILDDNGYKNYKLVIIS